MFLKFHADLFDVLMAMVQLFQGFLAGEALPRASDRESLFIEKAADLPDDQYVATLIVTSVSATLDRLELRKLLFPVSQHVRLYTAEFADLTDGEVPLSRDRR